MYAIHATRQTSSTDDSGREWRGVVSLPTFYLDPNVQGIVSAEHARDVALGLLRDANPDASFSVYATLAR